WSLTVEGRRRLTDGADGCRLDEGACCWWSRKLTLGVAVGRCRWTVEDDDGDDRWRGRCEVLPWADAGKADRDGDVGSLLEAWTELLLDLLVDDLMEVSPENPSPAAMAAGLRRMMEHRIRCSDGALKIMYLQCVICNLGLA
ncbi:hypothetical protein ACLOJK_019530, partial [Asimina triloba]